jgi:hypothetical protein
MARARADTGLEFVDHDAVEPLTRLLKSFNEESQLHEAGAAAVEERMLRMLKNRLRMLRDFHRHPEIAEQEIKSPIMISGTFRTGSTKLQRILAESADFNWLPLWTGINFASETGQPNEDTAGRIADAEVYVSYNSRMSPELDAAHNHDLYAPDEETFVGNQSFLSTAYFGYAQVPGYLQWLVQQDLTPSFEFIRDVLKYLQWQGLADPDKRWILKSPINVGVEEAVKGAFADAYFVVTHRSPVETIASLFSLLSSLFKCHTNSTIGDTHLLALGQAIALERHLHFRETNPDFPVLDVHYKQVATDIGDTIRRVYEFADVSLSQESFNRMMAWDSGNPIHKHGTHTYSLADYDLTPAQIEAFCPNYMAFYNAHFADLNLARR